jgi:hypothetical protein
MWSLWFIPLVMLSMLVGAGIGLATFLIRRRQTGRWANGWGIAALFGAPLGCLALPFIGFGALILIGGWLQKDDTQLFVEIFGYRPTIAEDRLLFDDFGSGASRAIYLRAEVTPAERQRLLRTPGARPSVLTPAHIEQAGEARQFLWWDVDACAAATVRNADGYRGWASLTLLDCPSQRQVYVIALRSAG